jgi:ribosome-associated toxin RatA of RatAB toxin-antitoxin module
MRTLSNLNRILLPCLTAGFVSTGPAPAFADVSPDLASRLRQGEIVVSIDYAPPLYALDVIGPVEGTTDEVWRAATSYNHYKDFLPLVTESELRKRTGNNALQYIKMSPPWPFHASWMLNNHEENKSQGLIRWTESAGNVKREFGFWQVVPLEPGKTAIEYHLMVDPAINVPTWLVGFCSRTVMPGIVKGIRRRVEVMRQP